MDGVFCFCRAFLQDRKRRDAGGKMQDELQEMRLAIHKAIYRLYKMHKRENGALCKTVDSSGKARIMRLVRKKCAAAKMQREIQNGGNENAECSCCLQRCLFRRYGRDDRARNEELKKQENPAGFLRRDFCVSKNLVEFRPAGRNKMEIHFVRRDFCAQERLCSKVSMENTASAR